MPNVLFLNATDKNLQVAVSKDGGTRTFVGDGDARRHNAALLPVFDRLLSELGLSAKDLTDVVCVSGPGSFTGIRCGASFSNGLARATGARLFAPTSLEIVGSGDRVVALDCKHGNFYALRVENGEKTYFETTGAALENSPLPVVYVPDDTLSELVRFGSEAVRAGTGPVDLIRPFYLKKSSAEREIGG